MAANYTCDLCGRGDAVFMLYANPMHKRYISGTAFGFQNAEYDAQDGTAQQRDTDLCKNCADEFKELVTNFFAKARV